MLYLVRMDVNLPLDMPTQRADAVKAQEREYSQLLQRDGRWVHLWRVVGEYSNYSLFDVQDNDELHELLSGLPLFPYMEPVICCAGSASRPSCRAKTGSATGGCTRWNNPLPWIRRQGFTASGRNSRPRH